MSGIFTTHVLERYCQRVLGMTETEAKAYVRENKAVLEPKVQEMFEASQFFWHGQAGDKEADFFYHSDGVIFVAKDVAILTLYHTDYGFGPEIDKTVARQLFKQVCKMRERLDKHEAEKGAALLAKDVEIENTRAVIGQLEEKLRLLEAEREQELKELEVERREIDTVAIKLINSVQYRMDLMALKQRKAAG